MKVFCIKCGLWRMAGTATTHELGPKFGDIVTASQCPVYNNNYDLAEWPTDENGNPTSWNKKHFIPLSQIDEKEFERNYNQEKVLK